MRKSHHSLHGLLRRSLLRSVVCMILPVCVLAGLLVVLTQRYDADIALTTRASEVRTVLVQDLPDEVWNVVSGRISFEDGRQRLLIDPLELSAVLPGAMDPAGAAELYGYINAGMWTVMPQLEQLTRIPDPGLHVEVDFDSEQLRLTGRLGVSLQIRDLFAIGWAFAKPVIRWLLAMRKRQSAAEKAKAAAQSAAKQRETVHTAPDGAGHTTTSTSTKES